ncbi:MAG TPA: hypothetical protein VKY92_04300 [Verrucomicrobiae bacterium]|nr:hypothetical protein [Verrucomicrobiae bacterium]
MKNRKLIIFSASSACAISLLVAGCAREISHTETSKVKNDGTVNTKEKTVTQSSDGTITKTEQSKTTRP